MLSLSLPLTRSNLKVFTNLSQAIREGLPTLAGVRTVAWIAAASLLVALMYLAQSSNAALIARNLQVKQDRIAELQRQDAQLRYDIAQATAPSTIERRALALGLGPAKHEVYSTFPQLKIDMAEVMPAFAPRAAMSVVHDSSPATPSLLDQLLALLGLGGGSDRAQAEAQ